MDRIFLYYGRPQDRENFEIEIIPIESAIKERWLTLLEFALKRDLFLEKNYSFLGFETEVRKLPRILRELQESLQAMTTIEGLPQDLRVMVDDVLFGVSQNDCVNPEFFFKLHHIFESLIGQVWSPSNLYFKAKGLQRYHIMRINWLCHELEPLIHNRDLVEAEHIAEAIVSFNQSPRFELNDKQSSLFTLQSEFGLVFAKYSQLGKCWMTSALEADEVVETSNISNQLFLTGEFGIDLGPAKERKDDTVFDVVADYAKNRGGPNFQKNLGRLPLGKLHPGITSSFTPAQLRGKLVEYWDLQKIILVREGKKIEATFSYNESQQNYTDLHWNSFSDPKTKILRLLGLTGFEDPEHLYPNAES